MSNIYVSEPPTSGKVLLSTSKGDVEVELWSKEAPKACRNLIALALEGYYDDMLWHRIVPGFCIQTGDPTGTGTGGESVYGDPFPDEINQRIKFNRRGLLAMANPGERDHNESQFFITLDATPELQGKHTIFGRISGPTIFNVLSISEVELSEEEPDRPVFPPKLHTIKVLDNPFDDIVPRITREEKRAQEEAKKKSKTDGARRREKVKKNTGLLSFGEAEEGADGEAEDARYKGAKSSHDLLKNDRRLRKEAAQASKAGDRPPAQHQPSPPPKPSTSSVTDNAGPSRSDGKASQRPGKSDGAHAGSSSSRTEEQIDLARLREEHESSKTARDAAQEISELEASIRGLSKRKNEREDAEDEKARVRKLRKGKALLEEVKRKYMTAASTSGSGGRRQAEDREADTMALLRKFQSSGASRSRNEAEGRNGRGRSATDVGEQHDEYEAGMREYGASDEEGEGDGATGPLSSSNWRNHRFDFGGKSTQEDKYTTDTYVTLDPRDTSSSAAASLGFGSADHQKRAREEKLRSEGRRGRDWVDERGERSDHRRRDYDRTRERDDRRHDVRHRERR